MKITDIRTRVVQWHGQTVPLPPHLTLARDAISASFRDGFLLVTLPKLQAPARPATTNIPVSGE